MPARPPPSNGKICSASRGKSWGNDSGKFEVTTEKAYNPELVEKIQKSKKEFEEGKFTRVEKDNLQQFLGLQIQPCRYVVSKNKPRTPLVVRSAGRHNFNPFC